MAGNDDAGEKSFEASAQRLQQARQKGNVPQSPELLTLARYAGILIAVGGVTGGLAAAAAERMTGFFINPLGGTQMLYGGGDVLTIFAPVAMFFIGFVGVAMALTLAALFAQQAITFAPTKLKPDLKKIDPMSNAKKKYGGPALIDFAKSMVKVLVLSFIGLVIAMAALPDMLASMGAPPALMMDEIRSLLIKLLFGALILAAAATAIDMPLKWSQHRAKLKMSRQEMVDEAKELDGSPEQKKARQDQARAIVQNQQINDVPSADVVIINPTHYSVALKWNRNANEVPRCVAKGVDHVALRIRTKAADAGVPVYRNVATARSLYATVEVGDEIQREHYEAVAAAIRFADGLRKEKPKN